MGLAYDFGVMALGTGVPMLHHVEDLIEPKRPRRPALVMSLAVLAGGFLLRQALLRAGNISAKRPKDYFRLTGGRRSERGLLPCGSRSFRSSAR